MKKLTTEEFIKRAKKIHGDKYDYSLVNYTGIQNKIILICPIHGKFEITANLHVHKTKKQGCTKCKRITAFKKITKTTEEFIKEARIIHGDKYDYSKVVYKNAYSYIDIICPIHGVFKQVPRAHIFNKSGCPNCPRPKRITTEQFKEKAKKIHGDKYDYSSMNYTGIRNIVKIICPKHGLFKQIAHVHINGSGCPVCNESKGEYKVAQYLDRQGIKYIREYKFNNCRNILPLPFDFYIPSLNMCIEYNGKQHYEPIKHFGGEKSLINTIKNDKIKKKYCYINNIKLLTIRYDNNIVEEIQREIN